KDPKLRCQSAAEMRAELQRIKRDTDSSQYPVGVTTEAEVQSRTGDSSTKRSAGVESVGPYAASRPKRSFRWKTVVPICLLTPTAAGLLYWHSGILRNSPNKTPSCWPILAIAPVTRSSTIL